MRWPPDCRRLADEAAANFRRKFVGKVSEKLWGRAMSDKWLHIVGIGEDGIEGLSPATRAVLEGISFGLRDSLSIVQGLGLPIPAGLEPEEPDETRRVDQGHADQGHFLSHHFFEMFDVLPFPTANLDNRNL